MRTGKRFSAELLPGGDPGPPIVAALDLAAGFAATAGVDPPGRDRLAVVVEELVSNALRHGAGPTGIRLMMIITSVPGGISLMIEDDGVPFDPTAAHAFGGPDRVTGGGVGIALVKALAQRFVYQRCDGKNRLEVTLGAGP